MASYMQSLLFLVTLAMLAPQTLITVPDYLTMSLAFFSREISSLQI
ncbi:hypothetical protein BMETH_2288_0 [methanotrophic bacterial endosymbiont of Bathymodiolus sp.]|nr:hypothetical protein BMETH_2288_0 [methanotrophic bacterial endosymbiont of Bathymodiolus sp.]